ncbi:pyrimidine 5'-nucleotidase [Hippea maritima]|uniref:Pyrimidine 5'-nucleotidase n=1 Tax=Hippea maritima (strain ATCC 700847 / DSM 10411 / MH2) TaxID=760142 RepID=F2LTL9_HIPMA|nr:pyrimidine 5'-nucleotidase [Hippea maritima]AEA33344.1 pyrimidine 5'-nucleotidase [Hippea maritima DSM 10411]
MKVFLIDVDNTLYPPESGVFDLVDKRINRYMIEFLGMDEKEVPRKRIEYWHTYGTTMAGLMRHYNINPHHFLEYTHDIDLKGLIKPNPNLRQKLKQMEAVKIAFTNAPLKHAEKVLSLLGVEDLFIDIFDIISADFIGKPHKYPYVKIINQTKAEEYIMADDFERNIETAKSLGIFSIHVGKQASKGHINVESFEKIPLEIINYP